jgi:hypothetical protein
MLHILKILSENIFLFLKIKSIHTKDKRNIDESKKFFKFKYITKKIIVI